VPSRDYGHLIGSSLGPRAEVDDRCNRGLRKGGEVTEFVLTPQEGTESAGARRFDVELFIVHPTLDPADISKALGMEAHFAHRVGDRRKTPKGALLPGNYPDSRWRHSIRCRVTDQWYAAELTRLVDTLEPHKTFFTSLKSAGGRGSVIIQFLGDGYLADEIPHAPLVKLVALKLALAIECFADPQS
jgi:hypothetical protein